MNKTNETPAAGKAAAKTADLAPVVTSMAADTLPQPEQGSAPSSGPGPGPSLADEQQSAEQSTEQPKEYGGPKGLEPTRYGDWERNGRCYDF